MIAQALSQIVLKRASQTVAPEVGYFGSNWLGASATSTNVSTKSALTLSAFYNGITIICNDYAKLPKNVYQKTLDGKGRNALFMHPVKRIIDKEPNQYMSAFNFDVVMLMAAILKGNAYAVIERNNTSAQPVALQYVDQDAVKVEVKSYKNKLWYIIDDVTYASEDILHIPGFSYNGIVGISVIRHAAASLGVSIASQEFAHEYYDGKGVGTGVLTTTKSMTDDAKTRYSSALSAMFGTKAKWVVPVIDEASKFEHLKITPQEAQFLLTSEQGVNEVARWLNISSQKLKNNKDVNNSISESLERQHVSDSILPWAIKFQQEYDRKLFSEGEKNNRIYTKFNTDSLLSADKVAQADYWSKLIQAGVLTRNEVRALLDRNDLTGLDEPLTPVNVQTQEQIDAKLQETTNTNSDV